MARAFLDSCAQSNFISEKLCSKLKVVRIPVNVQMGTLNQENTILKEKCEIEIKSRHSNYGFKLQCLIVPNIIKDKMPNSKIDLHDVKIPAHIKLADQTFYTPGVVDLLIGAEWFWQLLCIGQEKLGNLIMQKTKLGWVVGGPLLPNSASSIHCNLIRRVDIQEQLTKFWELEEISETKALSIEEKSCEELFLKTTRRDADGKFIVTIPLKGSLSDLGESRSQAEKRLINLERKLQKNTDLRKKYNAFMDEYLDLGHMSEVLDKSAAKYTYYMPHHAVTKLESETTKTRVVFDASATTSSGLSMNNLQMCGPVIQNDLFSIIVRFRKHQFIISADIAKMYRQVWIIPEQRALQPILWRRDPNESIKTYELNTVTYGTTAASFLAIRSLGQLAINNKDKFPNESKIILNDFYVDDLLTGGKTTEELSLTAKRINEILSEGGFKLRKWVSNNTEVLKHVIGAENLAVYGAFNKR
ncbi:uncharacterized protein [Linepithema humile]|uniref:uncharacterized protein n=1 Tax=Linepithema humile TaxID=83485 RepID=UPI00351DB36F